MPYFSSILRITFDPAGPAESLLLDWGDDTEPLVLPWRQTVQRDAVIGADWTEPWPRGNVQRTIRVVRRLAYADWKTAQAAMIAADAAWPVGAKAPLEIRVLDLAASTTGTETERTAYLYRAASAVVEAATPEPDPVFDAINWTIEIAVGRIDRLTT